MLKLKLQSFVHLIRRTDSLKRPWIWESLKAGGEGSGRGWDGWMASPTRCTWIWASSGSWWWTGKLGVLQSMGSQRVGYNSATELTKIVFRSMPAQLLNPVWLFVTPWTVAHHAPLSIEFSRLEYWNGLPFHPLEDLPDPGIEPTSPVSPAWQECSLSLSHLGSEAWPMTNFKNILFEMLLSCCLVLSDIKEEIIFLQRW